MTGKRTIWQLGFKFIAVALAGLLLSLSIHALGRGEILTEVVLGQTSPEPVAALLERGKTNYDAGRFSEAAELYKRAARQCEAEGYILNQALALSHLSLAYRQLGELQKAEEAIARSLSLLSGRSDAHITEQAKVWARVWNAKGSLLLATQKPEEALEAWREGEASYRQAGDILGVLGSQINQVQAMQDLGLYRQADALLEKIREDLQDIPDNASAKYISLQVATLHHLGNLFRQKGRLDEARDTLEQSLRLAERWHLREEASAILISLGNTARAEAAKQKASGERARQQKRFSQARRLKREAEKATEEALYFYRNAAIEKQASPQTLLQARLNYLSLLVESGGRVREAENLWRSARKELEDMPSGREAVYARVNLAKTLVCLRYNNSDCLRQEEGSDSLLATKTLAHNSPWLKDAIALFDTAVREAQELEDKRAESYAMGNMGRLYEEMEHWKDALGYSQEALNLANTVRGRDIAYQWQWQLGRLLVRENEMQGAMTAYLQAVKSLNNLRGDLANLNRDLQLDFRDEVEPVYRRALDFLLQPEPGTSQPSQEHLRQAREVFESLQVAELDDFFLDGCSPVRSGDIDEILDEYDKSAAAIHAILLEDRLAVILKLPGQKQLGYYESRQPKEDVQTTLQSLQKKLSKSPALSPEAIKLSQKIYKWLLQGMEQFVNEDNPIETLVFVLDRPLQNVPIAVLYDGDRYFGQKNFPIALAPAIKLLNTQSLVQAEHIDRSLVFTGGVGESQTIDGIPFQPIEKLKEELEGIGQFFPTNLPLVNRYFTRKNIERELALESFPIVHIKTHGQFSSDPEGTYIVAYRELIKSKDLDGLVKSGGQGQLSTIELLVLSACETAQGDDRASLGLAGVAVRAGARSTLSTLWVAQDNTTTQLMLRFYEELSKPNMTKARALHNAQKQVFQQYQIPYFWAPYVLVGNWR